MAGSLRRGGSIVAALALTSSITPSSITPSSITPVSIAPVSTARVGEQATGDTPTGELVGDRLEGVEALARGYVDSGRMPGVAVLALQDGRVVLDYRYGDRDLESGAPLETDTIYRIYSMTKPITGVAVMQLVESGRLALDDPVATYLPELAEMRVLVDPETGSTEPAGTMTVEHLMTHTSGLTYDDASGHGAAALLAAADLWEADDLADFIERLAPLPLTSQPGSRWEYGVSMDVLGRLVEVVSGLPFDVYLERHIFTPLGMRDTGFRLPETEIGRFASLYRRTEDDGLERIEAPESTPYLGPRAPFGGHGLVSTANDFARFATMLANGGELNGVRILSIDSVDTMTGDRLDSRYGEHPLSDSWLGDDALGLGFGLTGAVVRDGQANGVPGSDGAFFWGGGASTFFWVDRARGLVVVQLTQLMPSDSYPIREELRRLVYAALETPPVGSLESTAGDP